MEQKLGQYLKKQTFDGHFSELLKFGKITVFDPCTDFLRANFTTKCLIKAKI